MSDMKVEVYVEVNPKPKEDPTKLNTYITINVLTTTGKTLAFKISRATDVHPMRRDKTQKNEIKQKIEEQESFSWDEQEVKLVRKVSPNLWWYQIFMKSEIQKFNIIVETATLKQIPLKICSIDTINDIKSKIQDKEGIPIDQMILSHNYKTIQDPFHFVKDVGISENDKLRLTLSLRGHRKQVALKTLTTYIRIENVAVYDTLKMLKTKITEEIGVEEYKLIFKKSEMLDDEKKLYEYGVSDNFARIDFFLYKNGWSLPSEIENKWNEYIQLFGAIHWTNIYVPRSFNDINDFCNPYAHLILAVMKGTNNTPMNISNRNELIEMLGKVTEFDVIDPKQETTNFYVAYQKWIDENYEESKCCVIL
eukprot:185636_1